MVSKDTFNILLHEEPGQSVALHWASLTTQTEHLNAAQIFHFKDFLNAAVVDDVVPGAGEAELVSNVAWALNELRVYSHRTIFALHIKMNIPSPDIMIHFNQINKKMFRYLRMLKIFLP